MDGFKNQSNKLKKKLTNLGGCLKCPSSVSYTVEQGLVLWLYIREITSSIPSDKVMVILFSAKPAGTGQLFTLN